MDLPRPTPRTPCAKTGFFSLLAVTLLTATLPTLYAEDVRPPGNVGVNPVGLGNNRSEIENHVYGDNSLPEDVPLSESKSPLALENNRNVINGHLKDGDSSVSDDSKTEDSDLSDNKEIHTTTATDVEESDIKSARVTSATDVFSDRTTTPETVVTLTHTDAEVETTVSTSVVSFDGQEVASDEPNVDTVGDSSVPPQIVRATRATYVDSGIPKRHVSSFRGTYGEAADSTAFESFHSSAESKLNAPSGLEGEGSDVFPFPAFVESDPDTDLNPPPAGLKDDVNIFIPVEPTPRGKRTIDVLLTGLAQALGYDLKPRMNNNRKPKQTPAPTQPPPQTTATPPAPKPTKVSNAEPTTPKGHNASDVDLQAQKEESESEEDEEENEDEDRKGSARLTDGRRDEDGTLDGYFRSTAGNYFRKEYDRIRESERNPSWANNYHDDDEKGKYAAPSKREEEPEQQHFRYFIPEYDGDDSKGSRGALLHNFGATSEGPSFDYGKPFSYSFGIPFQEPQPSKEPVQFQGPSASYDDQPFYNTPTAVYPGPTTPYASEPKQPFNVEKGRPYHGPPLILVGGTQQFSVEKGRPEEGQESHQEGKTQPFNVEKGRPGGYDSRERTYQGLRPYPGPGSSSQQNRYEETQTSSHPDHTQAIFSPLRPPPPPPPSPSPSSQPQPLQQDPKVLNTFQASVAGKLPIISTSKPQMAQILNEMEGTKQISLWPPPFDYSFDVTEATVTEDKPIRISKQKSVIRTKSTQVVGEPKDWQKAGYLPGDKVLSYASPESIPPPLDETGHPAYPTRSSVENTPKSGVTESELRSALWFPPGRESLKASADEESRADSSKEESNPQDVEESRNQGSGEEEQESSNEEYNGGGSEEEARPGTADYYDPRQPPPNQKPPAAEQFSNRGPTVQPYSGVPQGSYSNARGPPPYSQNYHHSPSHSKEQSQAKYSSREQPYREDSRENYEAERQPQSPPGTYYSTRPLSSKEPSSGEVLHPEEPQRPGSQEYHSQRSPSTENQGHYITAGPPPNPQSYYNSEQYPTLYSTSVEGQEEPSRKPPGNSQGFFILDEPPKNQKSSSESTSYQQPYSDSKEFYQNTRQPFEAVPARESVSQSPPSKSAQEYLHVDQPSYTNIQPADAENHQHNNADRTQQYTNAGSPASYSHSPHTSSRESVNSEEPNQRYVHSQQPEGYSNSQPEAPRGSYQNSGEYQRPQTYNNPPPPEPTKTEQPHAYKLGAQQVPLTEAELLASVEADPDDALFALLSADLSTKQSVTNNPTTPEPINLNDFLKFWQSQSNTSEVKINPQGSQSALKAQTLYQLMHQDLSPRPPSINDVTDLPLDDPLSWFRSTEAPKPEESKKEEVPTKKPPVQPTETKTNSQVGAFIGLVIPNPLYVAAGAGGQTDVIASPTSPGFVLRAAVPEVEYKSFPQRKYVEIVRTTAAPASEEEVSAKPSEIDEERQPYHQNSFITSTEATFYHIKPLPTSSPKPFSRDVYPSDNTIYYQSPSEDLKEIHKPYSYYRKESDETINSNPPFLYHENHTKEFSVPTTTKPLSHEKEEVFSSTEKSFSFYDQEKDEKTSTQKSISLYEKSKSEYESSTHKPLFSYFHIEKSLLSSSERPFPYYKKPDISDSATHKAFHSSLQQDETTTTEATPLYEQQEQVIISTIKPYIPPAHHYGIRLPPSTTTTTTTTTTAIPPRSATKQLSTKVVATPPTGHYGIRLPPPPPPPPPPSPYRRRPRPRLSPEEMARRHHIEFLRHSHQPDDYDHGMYEEYPETDGARFLFGDEEDEEAEADERTSPSEDVPANGATRHWRSSPYQPPDGSRDFYRPSGHPRTQGYQPHGSFSLQSPLSDDYTSLDYYYVDPPPPRPRPSARLAQREAEEAAQAVKKRADAGTSSSSTPATPNLSAEATAASVPSTSKSLNKETISRVSKIHVTGKDLLVALHAQNAEVASLNTSFLRLSETLPPRQDIHDKLEAIYFTISELSSHLDRAKNPEIATTSSEVLELLKDISRRIPVSAPNHELLLNKMDAIANEYAAIVAQSTAIQIRTDELKEIFEYQRQTVESCVAKLVEREDAKIAVTTVVPTEAQHGGEVGEDSVKNRLDEIVSCLSHLMDETTSKDALLLDQNTQVSDIHDLVSQLLERAVDNSRGSEDLPSISAALTQLLAKLKIWDSQLNVQQDALNEINHNMSSAGHKMADGLGAVWECQQEILNNVKEISEKINMSMANCPGPDNQLALQIFPKIEEWLKLIVSNPLIKNNELIEEMFRSLEAVIPRLELKRIDDDSERIEISGTIDYIKEELALIQASNSEILSKFDVISNTIDLDGLECKTQLSDIQSNVMVLKKLQADCGTSLRKQISSIRPCEFDKDLELILASLDKIHIHLVSLTNDITSKPELNKIGSMLLEIKDNQVSSMIELSKQVFNITEKNSNESDVSKVRSELTKMFVAIQKLPEILSSVFEVTVKKELAEFRGVLNENLAYMKELMHNEEMRRKVSAAAGGSAGTTGAVEAVLQAVAKERCVVEGVATLHTVAQDLLHELRSRLPQDGGEGGGQNPVGEAEVLQFPSSSVEAPPASLLPRGSTDSPQGGGTDAAATAAATAVLLAAHLSGETLRKQSAEAAVREARRRLESLQCACRVQLDAYAAYAAYTAGTDCRHRRRRTPARRLPHGVADTATDNASAVNRRSRAFSFREHHSAHRRIRSELPKSTVTSSSSEKFAATRRRIRRLRSALRKLEQLSKSMETHYQNMLRELGNWIMQIAHYLNAPDSLQALKFPDVPSHIGTWFLQICTIADWSFTHLKVNVQRESSHMLKKESEHLIGYQAVSKNVMAASSVIIEEIPKSSSEKSFSKKSPKRNGKSKDKKVALSSSLILATVQDGSKSDSKPVETPAVSTNGKVSLNGRKVTGKIRGKSMKSDSTNGSDENTSDTSPATYTIVKEDQRPGPNGGVVPGSSDDLSLSVGSLGSTNSLIGTSDAANLLASSHSDDGRIKKRDEYWKEHKMAEEKLIAILDGLKEKILSDSPNEEQK